MSVDSLPLDNRPDVLVIGGGAAGMLAAASAVRAGARVVVVRKGEGATGLSSGAFDVADTWHDLHPGPDAPPFSAGEPYAAGLARLAAKRPRHPYARIGRGGRERIEEAMELVRDLVPSLGLQRKADGTNHVVVSPLGTTKRSAWLPAQTSFDLSSLAPQSRVCVADLEDLGNFSASRLGATLRWVASLGGHAIDVQVIRVPRSAHRAAPFENGRQMALFLDEAGEAEDFARRIQSAISTLEHPPAVVLVPAVLGLRRAATVWSGVEAAVGCPVREMLAFPPSAAGARLGAALQAGIEALGVRVVSGSVQSAELSMAPNALEPASRRIERIHARVGATKISFEPRAVVLSSGRFWGGGLAREGSRAETIFGLPVVTGGGGVAGQFIGALTADRPEKDHPVFRSGIAYSERLQPLNVDGTCFARNLFAAGSILGGYDPSRDGSGLGVCALTGLLAGEHAAHLAGMRSERP